MNTNIFCDRGFAAAKRELQESNKALNIRKLSLRLHREQSPAFCFGYLTFLLSKTLISKKDFATVFMHLIGARHQQPGWTFKRFSPEWLSWANEKLLPPSSISRRTGLHRATTISEQSRCPDDHIVPRNQTHCELCGALVHPQLFEQKLKEHKARWA